MLIFFPLTPFHTHTHRATVQNDINVTKICFHSQNISFCCVVLTGQNSMILNLWCFFAFNFYQESITRSVYLTHNCVLGSWVNRFVWINWIPRDSMYLMSLWGRLPLYSCAGKLKIKKQIWRRRICRRRHLLPGQPVTLTMTFPLRILLKMKTKIHTLKLPVTVHHQTQKQKAMQSLKSAGVRRCQSRSELDQVVIP